MRGVAPAIAFALAMTCFVGPAHGEKTKPLVRAEQSAASGWLRNYDYNQHRDLGRLTASFFDAYSSGDPNVLVRLGLLPRGVDLAALAARWASIPLTAEDEPFAVDIVAARGEVAVTYTRVTVDGRVDLFPIDFVFDQRRWMLDCSRGTACETPLDAARLKPRAWKRSLRIVVAMDVLSVFPSGKSIVSRLHPEAGKRASLSACRCPAVSKKNRRTSSPDVVRRGASFCDLSGS